MKKGKLMAVTWWRKEKTGECAVYSKHHWQHADHSERGREVHQIWCIQSQLQSRITLRTLTLLTKTTSSNLTMRSPTRSGRWYHGWQKKCWMDNIKDCTSCLCHNCSQGPHAKKTERGSLMNHPLWSFDNPISQGTELNCTAGVLYSCVFLLFITLLGVSMH